MFLIRRIFDDVTPRNADSIRQVLTIIQAQFPKAHAEDLEKLPDQLNNPLKYQYRSILLVAEDALGKVNGFAMLLHFPDVHIAYLEFISAAPSGTGGGVGGALYERVREEAALLQTWGIFFECSVDDPNVVKDVTTLENNCSRLRFYERYGARPIVNNVYASPVMPGDSDLYYLVYDDLGQGIELERDNVQQIVKVILERKYGSIISKKQIQEVVGSFVDSIAELRPYRYVKKRKHQASISGIQKIPLIVNREHNIHHVKDKGYVESPVRIASILHQIEKTGLFIEQKAKRMPEKHIKAVHDPKYVDFLHQACLRLPLGKSIYPIIFPTRNITRPPKDIELQVGYYCSDTFTPINRNAYLAARGAVDCALTAAMELLNGRPIAYALVRPPGHHAEKRAFGGFCYFNSAAVAANFLSDFGKVAVLDIDFHHGNGTQDIFYARADVLTISIHGDPKFTFPYFAGFADEIGEGAGRGFNINYPLPEATPIKTYHAKLEQALRKIAKFKPAFLVLSLGLDTAKDDPTGTWKHGIEDFQETGRLIGNLRIPTLAVQEGGYRTRTLGYNAAHFFRGLSLGASQKVGVTISTNSAR